MNTQEYRINSSQNLGTTEEEVSQNAENTSNDWRSARQSIRLTSMKKMRQCLFQGRMVVESNGRLQTGQINLEGDRKIHGRRRTITQVSQELSKLRSGHWCTEEKIKYYQFIVEHQDRFEKKELRRIDKVFKLMSQTIQSRAPDQCRSHHQKMQKKYGGFKNLLEKFSPSLEGKNTPAQDKTPIVKVQCQQKQLQTSKASTPVEGELPDAQTLTFNFDFLDMNINSYLSQVLEEPNFMHECWVKRSITEQFQEDARKGYLLPI